MANEKRVRSGFKKGTLGAQLLIGGTTLNFGTDPGFATLLSTEHLAIILDPQGTAGPPEVVYVTAYTALGTTATIVRGQEGTAARQHEAGVAWSHGPTVRDFTDIAAGVGAALTSATPGNATNSDQVVPFNAAAYDDIGMWSAGSPNRLTVPPGYGGLWLILGSTGILASTTDTRLIASIRKNGTTVIGAQGYIPKGGGDNLGISTKVMVTRRLADNEYVELIDGNLGGSIARNSAQVALEMVRLGN